MRDRNGDDDVFDHDRDGDHNHHRHALELSRHQIALSREAT